LARDTGFAPLALADARLLVLGTLPGQASLAKREYYAHPQNAFWPILAALFGFDATAPYAARVAALARARIAVWDVCRAATRPGSLDSALVASSVVPNDFAAFFIKHPKIEMLAFNGATAAKLYRRLVVPYLAPSFAALPCVELPSTSPAHARLPRAEKQRRWSVVRA
jgi:double-stranded uracil-DNA glycosylase